MKLSWLKQNSPLRRWYGPLTAALTLRPGAFGLGRVPARLAPTALIPSVCGFCSTGCSLNLHLRNGRPVNLTPEVHYPVNLGMACPKGWEALAPLAAPDRATTPLIKDRASGRFQPADWEQALQLFVRQFKSLQARFGPDALAWIGTGQITVEELAYLGALAKFGMGIRHGDGNTRQCMATAATAYKESFGFDAPPFTYADFEESDVLVFVGSNLCIAHPILWQRVLRNKKHPKIFVLDPRLTETAMGATHHLPLKPKSDLLLFYGVANLLIQNDWIDREFITAHTDGFAEFAAFVRQFPLDHVASFTGLSVGQIYRFAAAIHEGKAVSFWWTMGVNQGHEATRTAQAIINLALLTGNIGRPGTGANSITGQCNAMGSRLFSNTTNLIGGHDFANLEHRRKIARTLGIPAQRIPDRGSKSYDQILEAIDQGQIKGLWIIATNTAHSWIHQNSATEVLRKLDFLVVQDMYGTTETAQLADLILPAAGWGEKTGTFINSERRFGLTRKACRPPGSARPDFEIFQLIAQYWGCNQLLRQWTSPAAVFELLQQCTADQPCDITGIAGYRMLDELGGVQWPLPAATTAPVTPPRAERRLFEDGRFFTATGRARFVFEIPRSVPEPTDRDYPFVLLTGRGSSAQWHTQTRTAKSTILRQLYPAAIYAELNPLDARRLGIGDRQRIVITSKRGAITATAHVTASVPAGHVFVPMHYPETNRLTFPAFDPYSRQPAYKFAAVRVEPTPVASAATRNP